MVDLRPEAELELGDAFEKLKDAVAAMPPNPEGGIQPPHRPGSAGSAEALDVAAALAIIPNNNDLPWVEWNRLGLAAWRATGGSEPGFAAFCAWSAKSEKYDALATRARWDHYRSSPPDQIGAGTLFYMARQARPDWRKPSDQAKESNPPPEFDDPPPPEDAAPSRRRKPNGGDACHFHLVRFAHIKLDTSPPYLVKGLIPREGLVLVWGPPKCGKTFWTFDLAMHIALGWEYRGRYVEAGTVVYVACEGERGLAARSEAFRQKKIAEDGADPPFFLLTTRLDLCAQVDALIMDVATQIPDTPCAAIVLDTLNRSIRGSESNDEDMSGYIAAADALRDRFKCAVIIIHHCGIDASRPRGHTSLTGAVDAQIAVKRDAASRIITTVEWMKDGPEGDQIVSRLDVTNIGDDEDGEAMTSCVVEADDEPQKTQAPARRMSPKDQIALDALHKATAEAGEIAPTNNHVPENARGVTLDTWRRYYLLGSGSDGRTQDARWKAFQRSRDSLQARHAIQIWGDFVWTT